ncbi:tektin-1 [Bacillus rossius redtenbacheri]|uniref:tektin-1 n=1 Tax=Bacillus rossius redtenbacheri TaxID=93214 RepID=UPI002FDE1065
MSGQRSLVAVPPPPTRFSLSEWCLCGRERCRTAADQQRLAELVLGESSRVRDVTAELTALHRREVEQSLQLRVRDVQFLKDENERQKAECCLEEEALGAYKERIQSALKSLRENALKLCKDCIILREGRLGIDLCRDSVEKELKKEIEIIEGAEALLVRTLEQTQEQLRSLRSTKYFLDRDNEQKSAALGIDRLCTELRVTDLGLSTYHGDSPLAAGHITYEEWTNMSRKNIDRAAKEINTARPLRSYVDTLLKQIIEDLWRQYHLTNNAFQQRIAETRQAKENLEKLHNQTVVKINEMVRNITSLQKAVADKKAYVALAHTRLGNRAQRPQMELCKDEVELNLLQEVNQLTESVTMLQEALAEAEASLRYLLRVQIQLEEDINIKTNTLKIDEVECMTIRLSMDYHAY